MFGKNIKKIRSVYGLSQQEFADIFELKRGTLGAYEENRSNPKLETVIKIANHFSIGLEELLVSELTVNKLLKFNELLAIDTETFKAVNFKGIPCLLSADKSDFIKNYPAKFDLDKISKIQLPFVNPENMMAFSVDDLSMTSGALELLPKDIVIGSETELNIVRENSLVVVLTKDELLLRRLQKVGADFILKADHHGVENIKIKKDDIICIWKVEHVFNYSLHSKEILLENRLSVIEQSIASLENKK